MLFRGLRERLSKESAEVSFSVNTHTREVSPYNKGYMQVLAYMEVGLQTYNGMLSKENCFFVFSSEESRLNRSISQEV